MPAGETIQVKIPKLLRSPVVGERLLLKSGKMGKILSTHLSPTGRKIYEVLLDNGAVIKCSEGEISQILQRK